ncbi:MAG: sulfatase [Myxococcota bacterium]|nr:sulfatase [Myxococcota bacterium]
MLHTMPLIAAGLILLGAATPAWGKSVLLDRHPERVTELVLADQSRDAVPAHAPVQGPWRIVHSIDGVRTWEARLPVRPRTLFFHRPPSGMKLERRSKDAPDRFRTVSPKSGVENSGKTNTWAFSANTIHVRRPIADGPPKAGEYRVRYPRARERERALNRSMSDVSDAEFVFRSVQIGDTNRHGLFLPAPSRIRYAVDVPDNGVLRFDAILVPPESVLDGQQSDGATAVISVGSGGTSTEVARVAVSATEARHRIDLSAFAGQQIELGIATETGATETLDYVFIAEPTVYTPTPNPQRMVLVFIDTLRADALGLYGYERDTSPKLDAWSSEAAVFTQARSVAPWTLPSARTMVTGTHPERWDKVEKLQDRLASNGWATGMVAGNVYLSSNFEMADGWGMHQCINWPQGSVQIQRGLAFLERYRDQDAFLMLHLMDMHLPYTEPFQYRSLFAGSPPSELGSSYFLRHEITRAARTMGEDGKAYVRGRYDNNMRYLDDQLARFFQRIGDDAVVMIVSDHGEEFWDHGGFEHGHTLYDELLRVPMILKGPGIEPGVFRAPTSLIDVAPTFAGIAGVDGAGMEGSDLRLLASGKATDMFRQRPQAFGRPLYGLRRWGSLENGTKFMVHQGVEELYDLDSDPGEQVNLATTVDTADAKRAIGTALDRPVGAVWRMVLDKSSSGDAVTVTLNAAVAAAWVGDDPTMKGKASVSIDTDKTVIRWPKQRGMVEVFLVPPDPLPDTLEVGMSIGKRTGLRSVVLVGRDRPKAGRPDNLFTERLAGRQIRMTTTVAPIPSDVDGTIQGFDAEVAGDLESLGYIDSED